MPSPGDQSGWHAMTSSYFGTKKLDRAGLLQKAYVQGREHAMLNRAPFEKPNEEFVEGVCQGLVDQWNVYIEAYKKFKALKDKNK